VLFVVVFAIMVYSMVKHRKSVGAEPATSAAPPARCSGSGCWCPSASCSSSTSC
jgi:hypothetical protein